MIYRENISQKLVKLIDSVVLNQTYGEAYGSRMCLYKYADGRKCVMEREEFFRTFTKTSLTKIS
jgi:hypothetical protein